MISLSWMYSDAHLHKYTQEGGHIKNCRLSHTISPIQGQCLPQIWAGLFFIQEERGSQKVLEICIPSYLLKNGYVFSLGMFPSQMLNSCNSIFTSVFLISFRNYYRSTKIHPSQQSNPKLNHVTCPKHASKCPVHLKSAWWCRQRLCCPIALCGIS